ncbi:deoxyguanosinetriphosphate triphosphohydrolase [Pseudemcibacter aquimaris]|uniref:deoxyguanosinetriphosphate triphosphohydrolase n=1 Tax=Pseudemcibacter aquimaris TaxID=2857064 RepID=UPI0020132613|nr:deoxyguanosinetriphosphate triphosphohydrolase [Pseudemcibacter aquimaris]MCC3860528.1 deoxyguanosinetriphosphate triphosphohydrolase [Pseudemcibacter aquimaris]WDU59353.1 deoxyguanosinetriphosphate triphosphohydrolase [Pseudemcibacter aquimaris]
MADFEIFNPEQNLAPYALIPGKSRGRLHNETESHRRSEYQRDRDRIIHSGAFRKLKHKTQVFVHHVGDYYRTRLTHSIEVAQIGRSIARNLGLNEDVTEALALAHDFGHTPFGHVGEEALDEAIKPYGGFDHNAQSLRVVTILENRYADFPGLNLTWDTLEGLAKHNGPLVAYEGDTKELHVNFNRYLEQHDLEPHTYASAEAQAAAIADDIAYNSHDLADGLRAGLITLEQVAEVPLVRKKLKDIVDNYGKIEKGQMHHELTRRLIAQMVNDVTIHSQINLKALAPETVDDIRGAGKAMIDFSENMRNQDNILKKFLMKNMYRHYKVNRMSSKARRVVTDLFNLYLVEPECLPTEWQKSLENATASERARRVADFIAGMTDRFALLEHQRLFDTSTFEL